jgi:4-hydroxyphenylpyruvate dioxygenase-like putative hemolysin
MRSVVFPLWGAIDPGTENSGGTMFKRIDHVEIVTDQLDRTVQFYTDVLGFKVKTKDRIERSG